MVRRHAGGEADLLGLLDVAEQLRRVDLLERTVKPVTVISTAYPF
jgi:hypothetical protein